MGSPITAVLPQDVQDATEGQFDLSKADRCDRCTAQAFVVARQGSMMLLFCGHHYARNEVALDEQGFTIDDFRHLINAKPSVSANADYTAEDDYDDDYHH
jgi:hypothetical protein